MPPALLLDVGHVCDQHTDAGLEAIYKAIGEDPPDADIWAAHPNPFIRRIVELFTDRGLDRINGAREELLRWISGAEHRTDVTPTPRPAGAMRRWSPEELAAAGVYLRHLPPPAWTLDDWMMLVDYLVQRYLPEGDLRSEADWLTTRSNMMGRVQAAMGEATEAETDTALAMLPADLPTMAADQRAAIDYGRARCAENVVGLADAARHRLKRLIIDYQQAVFLGDRAATAEDLRTKLLDAFGTMNRDWRRIAVTEATECVNQGFVAASKPGDKLRRVERYHGACPFCRSIDGRVFTVVEAAEPAKDGETQVWVGKTNVGRAAAPRRRVGSALVDREPHERWWPAAGTQHPHCRGSWVRVGGASEDPEFEAWLKQLKEQRR